MYIYIDKNGLKVATAAFFRALKKAAIATKNSVIKPIL